MRVVTAAEMAVLEEQSERAGVSTGQLMENAGLAVAQEAWLMLGTLEDRQVLVLVGPGNNGGDGLVAARHLHDWGAKVTCYLTRAREGDANLEALLEREVDICTFDEDRTEGMAEIDRLLGGADLVIDALLGTGRRRMIDAESPFAVILDKLRAARARGRAMQLLAVDLPTGVDADGAMPDPHAVRADATVALGYSKVGLHLLAGGDLAGQVQVVDIGLPEPSERGLSHVMTLRETRDLLPERPADSNKGTFGKVMVAAGSVNYVGAAYLCTAGAMRAGAGLVTLACPRSVYPLLASRLVESTFLALPDSESGRLYGESASQAFNALEGYDALLVGCGIGQDDGTLAFVRDLLFALDEQTVRGVVVDADGLNNLAQMPRWWESLRAACVLTPHPGEFARLTQTDTKRVQADRLNLAREAAERWSQTVVLKGANTIVAGPSGEAWICPFGNAALASAGTGDVLAGVIAALIGQGLDTMRAAVAGVYLHAATGELLSAEMGDAGVLAGDVLAALPRTLKEIKS
jgi:NAD(P)H-hydrate epimerase